MSGVLVKKLGRKYSFSGPPGQLVDVLREVVAVVLPGEVGVALGEADLRELAHHGPAGEGLGQEDDVAVDLVDLADQPLPERDRLRVRVVDPEDLHAELDPLQGDPAQLLPQGLPVGRVPVEVVDVLVLLGWVLRVLQRAVRALEEPLRVLLEPRVVRGALDGEVERDVDLVLRGGGAQRGDIVVRAQLLVHRVVAARRVADRPRRARVVRGRHQHVVGALAVREADGMDRRQVEDVEAELGQPGELGLHAAQPAEGAREQLVPGAEAGPHALHLEPLGRLERRRAVALRAALHRREQLVPQRGVELGRVGHVGVVHDGQRVLDQPPVALGRRGRRRLAQQHGALAQLPGEALLAAGDLALELVAPRRELVDPGLHGELPAAHRVDHEGALPAHALVVGVDGDQLGLDPLPAARRERADHGAQLVVAVPEHVAGDLHQVPHGALRGVAAGVHRRLQVLDVDAGGRLSWRRGGHRPGSIRYQRPETSSCP